MTSKSPTIFRIEGSVRWEVLHAKGGNWVGICDPLRLTLQADTWANLMEDISFTLDAIFKDLLSSNELTRFLKEHGWKSRGTAPKDLSNVRFDLPFIPTMVSSHGSQRPLYK